MKQLSHAEWKEKKWTGDMVRFQAYLPQELVDAIKSESVTQTEVLRKNNTKSRRKPKFSVNDVLGRLAYNDPQVRAKVTKEKL